MRGKRLVVLTEDFFLWPSKKEWVIWASRCGLDPLFTLVPGHIYCDDDAYTVTALTMEQVEGRSTGHGYDRVVQLEAPAPPFPPGGLQQW